MICPICQHRHAELQVFETCLAAVVAGYGERAARAAIATLPDPREAETLPRVAVAAEVREPDAMALTIARDAVDEALRKLATVWPRGTLAAKTVGTLEWTETTLRAVLVAVERERR